MAKAKSGTKKVKQQNRQVNQYDKILHENLEAALPGLIRNLLGIHAVHTEELPDDIQHTKERKPDVLKKVTDKNDETFVLHIEFQVKDEPKMVYRMAEYYIMLLRRYELPVRQYVIYIGRAILR
jgi:predicted transposase/invertase (TIGR01784 family)